MKAFAIHLYTDRNGKARAYVVLPNHKRSRVVFVSAFWRRAIHALVACVAGDTEAADIFSAPPPERE